MNHYQEARAVREEAQAVVNYVAGETVKHRLNGTEPPPYITTAGEAARDVLLRAGEIEAETLTAAMEQLDPTEFKRDRRKRQARRRMAALRQKGAKR